jgi:hypothetical protein
MLSTIQIARVAHEVNKAYCQAIGDNTQPSWEDAPEWQKSSAIAGVQFHINNPGAKPEDSHNSWLAHKEAEGWVYGEVKDAEKKTHPCMRPYSELPVEQRVKDYLFIQVVHSLSAADVSPLAARIMNVNFNPDGNSRVNKIKLAFAQMFDIVNDNAGEIQLSYAGAQETEELDNVNRMKAAEVGRLSSIAKTHLETAQMFAVKAVTR